MRKHLKIVTAAVLAGAFQPAQAQEFAELGSLKELSIEELAQVEVTSASKRPESIAEAPTAIFVISDEEILRSAATSLPEVLRMAPNLQVQQVDARQYAVSARGFNGYETANKMLALIDGRTIYTPLFSGVLWELHSPLLEDIQQIEVISGPGGTLYGPNAVNGVISVQSKTAFDTLGGLVRGTLAANDRTAALRYGLPIGSGAVRAYGNYFHRSGRPTGAVGPVEDRLRGYQVGFRSDFGSEDNRFTLQGDLFDTDVATVPGDGEKGHNLVARWNRALGDASSFRLQAFYDKYERRFTLVRDALETFDLEAQYNGTFGRHEIVAGIGGRTTRDAFINRLNPFVLDPERRRLWVGNAFVQDRFRATEALSLIAGIKLEQSSLSGLEILPNLRVAWHPHDRFLLWGAVSRAVRTPSRIDRQLVNLPLLAKATGFRSEKLTAIEVGYRGQPTARLSLSVNLFLNLYDDLRTTELAPNGGLPIRLANSLHGRNWGVEAWATQQVAAWWRLRLGVATLGEDFEVRDGRRDLTGGESAGNNPDYKISGRSQMDLTDRVSLDIGVRAVDDLERFPTDSYIEADARLGWRVSDAVELYVAGSNLLHDDFAETNDPKRAQRAERSILAGTRLSF